MSYVVPIHRPTSTRHAIKLNFLDPDDEAIIVAKANRLEIYTQSSDGFTLLCSKTIYGYITMLDRLRPNSSTTDHLFVGTDRYQYFTCSWDAETRNLKTEQSFVDVADKQLRDSREMDRCRIDPTRRYMTLEVYDGIVMVIPIVQQQQGPKKVKTDKAVGSLSEPVQVRIEEMLTRDSAFVQTKTERGRPRLAILYEDNHDVPQLKLRELKYHSEAAGDPASVEMETVEELAESLDLGASHLIPVPAPHGGFLILGERSISYVDSDLTHVNRQDLEDDATIWTCWAKVDDRRWLLADDYGRLYFLMIAVNDKRKEGNRVESWKLDHIGTASKASCLVYLDEGFVFIGSHSGDSQIVQIVERGVKVIQSFANIAPILDLSIMDLGRGAEGAVSTEFSSGQARVVTASGAWQDGSIRGVRSGVGMEEIGVVGQLPHITDLWALSSTGSSDYDDVILATFVDETRVFKFDEDASVEELDKFNGLEFSEPTLFVSNLTDRRLLQVTETGIRIADLESNMLLSQWKPSDTNARITTASANSVHLLVVEGGHTLHVFHTTNNDLTPTTSKTFPLDSQIASVTLPDSRSSSCIIAFWQSATICVLDLHSLETIATQSLGTPGTAIPRSILVANVLHNSPPTLFIAMADGTVITYSFDVNKYTLTGMTRIILGTEPVFFKLLPRERYSDTSNLPMSNVFASCEQPSLIYSTEGRMIYSAVNSDKASRICHFNSQAYPGAVAIATPAELKLAMIGTERTTQLQTLPVGETVRCIAYEPKAKMFGMGCVRRLLESGEEALLSCVKIADEVSFKELDDYELRDGELVECIISTGTLEDDMSDIGYNEMFVVGTSLLQPETRRESENVRGRILVFEVNKERKLKVVTELGVKGACRSLAMCDGKVVAGLVKTVVIYALTPSTTHGRHSLQLTKQATYRTSTNPLSLAVTPSASNSPAVIAVGDLMKSLSILTLHAPGSVHQKDGPLESSSNNTSTEWSLVESARHFATVWSSAVACIGENEWLLADMEGNLLVLRRNVGGVTVDDRRRLEIVSEYRLGEVVNKIVPIFSPGTVTAMAAGAESLKRSRTMSSTHERQTEKNNTASRSGPLVTPAAFVATVEGGVYLHATINAAYADPLMRLQSALGSRVQAPGHMPWGRYRALKTEVREAEEGFRIVDGEVIECILGMEDSLLQNVVEEINLGLPEGNGVSMDEVRGWAEGLRRLY